MAPDASVWGAQLANQGFGRRKRRAHAAQVDDVVLQGHLLAGRHGTAFTMRGDRQDGKRNLEYGARVLHSAADAG